MSIEQNKATARRHFEEVWNKGRVELLDDYYAVETPGWSSLEKYRTDVLEWRKVAPDCRFTIVNVVAEGHNVMVYWKVEATCGDVSDLPPSNPMPTNDEPLEFDGIYLMRFRDGKLVSIGAMCDRVWLPQVVAP